MENSNKGDQLNDPLCKTSLQSVQEAQKADKFYFFFQQRFCQDIVLLQFIFLKLLASNIFLFKKKF